MLFPRDPEATATGIELVREDDGFPVVLATGLLGSDASGLPLLPNGPGLPLLGEHARGRFTRPHLRGQRDGGRAWSTKFTCTSVEEVDGALRVELVDRAAALRVITEVQSVPGGALRVRHTVVNIGDDEYDVHGLEVVLPAADHLTEVLDFTGRHERERNPQRHVLSDGLWLRESRSGRPGLGAATMAVLGSPGFSTTHGDVLGVHVGWSGNSVLRVERDPATGTTLGGGELLLPGEVRLASGESYASPWVYVAAAADGLDGLAAVWHAQQRSQPTHPPHQPVVLNVWEAVYFDHDPARLIDLAERAAALGVERYVLDDGWFGARRDDRAGLGDWVVSPEVWPDGLHPLVNRVTELGMQFGLWFEPEMVNPDSDVARAHPEWLMQLDDRLPLEGRFQQVLNLSIPGAYGHVLGQMSAILEEYAISYVKWDHNRDLNDAGTAPDGRPAVAAQTRAFYALLDELRRCFPQVEFESCSSGGSRIDLEVMERAERVWVSDNIDPDDRQRMLWWTSQLLPAELLGSHIASGRSHVTGRWHDLNHRAATAVFGHLGIEWDLARASEEEIAELAWWIAWYKEHRGRLLTGRLVRVAMPDPGVWFKGVVNEFGGIYSLSMLEATPAVNLGVLRFPGLEPGPRYRVRVIERPALAPAHQVPWLNAGHPLELTGAQLMHVGLRAPVLRPATTVLFVVTKV